MFVPQIFGLNPSTPGISRRNTSLRRKRSQVRLRPFLESLEPKIVPATFTWTGLGSSNNWSVSQNWTHTGTPNNPVPTSTSDVIIFPAGSPRKTTVNDLSGEGSTFNSVTIQDSGYNISGYAADIARRGHLFGSGFIHLRDQHDVHGLELDQCQQRPVAP